MGVGLAFFGLIVPLACSDKDAVTDSTQDSGQVDTEWVDTAQEVFLESIELHPARITVEPGAELTLRAVGVYSDGHREGLKSLELSSSDGVSARFRLAALWSELKWMAWSGSRSLRLRTATLCTCRWSPKTPRLCPRPG